MKVAANVTRSFSRLVSASSVCLSTRSILLSTRSFGCRTSERRWRMISASSSRPRLASISAQTKSASWAPIQAWVTMARSSRRLGAKTPGVSMKISWASSAVAMPRNSARVVCTLWETIATLVPTSALMSVDFPTLGAPISALKPHRLPSYLGSALSAIRLDAFAGEHGGSGGLFGGALGTAEPLRRGAVGQFHRDPEHRIVVRTLPFHFAIVRGRQSARLRPFLQNGLGVAQRPRRRSHPRFPEPLDQFGSRRISAVDEYGPDQCLADIGQDPGA